MIAPTLTLERLVARAAELSPAPVPRGGGRPQAAVLAGLRSALAEALADKELLPRAITSAPSLPPTGVGKYLVERRPGFTLFCTVTAPGAVLPAHDHGSWGLVGVYRGTEEEICYVPVQLGGPPGLVALAESRRIIHRPGDVAIITPPVPDIHGLVNRGGEQSIALHLFGHDVVASGFRLYAPAHLVMETGPLAYDQLDQ